MIHQYKLGGYNIVLDLASGAVHAVDEVAYDIISEYEGKSRDEVVSAVAAAHSDIPRADIEECYDQVAELAAEGRYRVALYTVEEEIVPACVMYRVLPLL